MIRGEKVFTDGARKYAVAAARRQAKLLRARAERCDALATAIATARTAADLEKVDDARYEAQGTHMAEDFQHLVRGNHSFDNFYRDYRSTCSYCGRKVHGGTGMTLLGRYVFACTADACDARFEREMARDKKLHPRKWEPKRLFRRGDRVRQGRRPRWWRGHASPSTPRARRAR